MGVISIFIIKGNAGCISSPIVQRFRGFGGLGVQGLGLGYTFHYVKFRV